MRHASGPYQLLNHIPPAGAPLHRELDPHAAGEPLRQPHGQMCPVRGPDLPPLQPAGASVDTVEGDLLPVNVEPTYD
jgi:hypothetical protein